MQTLFSCGPQLTSKFAGNCKNMPQFNSINIEWNLSCPQSVALKKLRNSVDTSFGLGWYKIRGRVEDTYLKIWTKTPGMRGLSIATGKGEIIQNQNNTSQLMVSLAISWPFYYFKFSKMVMRFVVILGILSWCISLTGAFFSKYDILADMFFPVGVCSILLIILSFVRYLGESELNDLSRFLEKSLSSCRKPQI